MVFFCVQEQHGCRLQLIVGEQVFVAETNTAAAAQVSISITAVHMCGDKLSESLCKQLPEQTDGRSSCDQLPQSSGNSGTDVASADFSEGSVS